MCSQRLASGGTLENRDSKTGGMIAPGWATGSARWLAAAGAVGCGRLIAPSRAQSLTATNEKSPRAEESSVAGLDRKGAVVIRCGRPTALHDRTLDGLILVALRSFGFASDVLIAQQARSRAATPRRCGSERRISRWSPPLSSDLRPSRPTSCGFREKGEPWSWYHPCLLMTRARASDAIRL